MDTENGLEGYFEFNTDLFIPETIKRLVENFKVLLYAIADNPNQTIGKLPILSNLLGKYRDSSPEKSGLNSKNHKIENYHW